MIFLFQIEFIDICIISHNYKSLTPYIDKMNFNNQTISDDINIIFLKIFEKKYHFNRSFIALKMI
jgi:hypothetical protein